MKHVLIIAVVSLLICSCFPEPKPKEELFVRLTGTDGAGFKSYETNKITFNMVSKCLKRLEKYKLSEAVLDRMNLRDAPYATCKKGAATISCRVPGKTGTDTAGFISIYDKDKKLDIRVYYIKAEEKVIRVEDRSILYDGAFGEEIIDLTIEYLKKP